MAAPVSRRDFLRLRGTEQGQVLELSCRELFMRLADAGIGHGNAPEWEPWMGEPPAVLQRRSADELVRDLAAQIQGAQVLRLHQPDWLDALPEGHPLRAAIADLAARGGRVER